MLLPAQCQVRFDIPMDTNDESQYNGESGSPTSNVAVGNTAFYFGIGVPPPRFNFTMDIPMLAVESTSPTMQQPLNLGFKLPIPVSQQTPLLSSTPFNLGFQLPPASTPPQAALPAGPVQQPFNLGFQLTPSSTPPQAALPAGPVQQAFNLGFQLPIPINQPQAAAHSAPAFNLGFDAPIPATQTAAVESAATVPAVQTAVQHVGYTTNNKSFWFNCEPLSPIGDWKPVPIRAPLPMVHLLPCCWHRCRKHSGCSPAEAHITEYVKIPVVQTSVQSLPVISDETRSNPTLFHALQALDPPEMHQTRSHTFGNPSILCPVRSIQPHWCIVACFPWLMQ
ncbi:hypothetical protein EDB19DRAFT_1915221 [Suillus lakei]|nr:hypothetical protein EDB19DRAFT_1915221 [Suillus lakei]